MARRRQNNRRREPIQPALVEKGPVDVVESLFQRLSALARALIEDTQDLSRKENRSFLRNPDGVREHDQQWHQWGIITHTKMFARYHDELTPQYLEQWGVAEQVDKAMAEQIDGRTKAELFRIFIVIHDLGKFTTRQVVRPRGRQPFHLFEGHAAESGRIIREPEFSQVAERDYGLTAAQIEYIATLADLHFEMGNLRHVAKSSEDGYTIEFAHSQLFQEQAALLMDQHPDFDLEICLSFLADSLAKTELQLPAVTDEEVKQQTLVAKQELVRRHLSARLISAVKQWPASREVCAEYLKLWARRQQTKNAE